ncbi:phosphoprotein ECPP44-like [Salvia miltiorrhiza]|uniref:phosphoprotein ECPP44-like n=1 Tax=Salvia miltiorrhiza TaxID=226208 RepID=UPI0025AC0A69|nr:phosphoprotein ECPP44-like [Salvia miltiorrhiza]
MADQIPQAHGSKETPQDRGCFDFLTNKEEKKVEDVAMKDVNAGKEEKHALMDELRRAHSQSSCSSDEEVEEGGERKKKKGLKEEIKDKLSGKKEGEDVVIPIEEGKAGTEQPEEKKGFLDKVKEKLPGQHKKGDEESQTAPPPATEHSPAGCENKEKKGIIDKIKEKLPGHHKKSENEVEN